MRHSRFLPLVLLAVATIWPLTGHAANTRILGKGSKGDSAPEKGIPYFLPKAILLIKTAPETLPTGELVGVRVTIEKQIVADLDQRFTLQFDRGLFSSTDTTIALNGGLLTGVNNTVEGQVGTALESVASFVFGLKTVSALEARLTGVGVVGTTAIAKPLVGVLTAEVNGLHLGDPESVDENDVRQFERFIRRIYAGTVAEAVLVEISASDRREILQTVTADLKKGHEITLKDAFKDLEPQLLNQTIVIEDLLSAGPPIPLHDRMEIKFQITREPGYCPSTFFGTPRPDRTLGSGKRKVRIPGSRPGQGVVYARTEHPLFIVAKLMPAPLRVRELLKVNVKAATDPIAAQIKLGYDCNQPDWWVKRFALLKTEADDAKNEARAIEEGYLERLLGWLNDESKLTDGQGAFRNTVLATYATLESTKISNAVARAKEKAAVATAFGSTGLREFTTNLAKLYLIEKQPAAIPVETPFTTQSIVINVPSPEAYEVPFSQLAFGRVETGMTLEQGVIRSVSEKRPAPVAEVLKVPANIASSYIALLKELITIRVNTVNQSSEALAKELANAKVLKELEGLNASPDVEAEAHAAALLEVSRQRELLATQLQLLQAQQSITGATDSSALQHQAMVTLLQRQKEMLELEAEIAALENLSANRD